MYFTSLTSIKWNSLLFGYVLSWWLLMLFLMLSTSSYIFWSTECLLWKFVYTILCPLINHCFLAIDLYEFLIYFGWLPLSDWYEVCKYFLPFHRLSFHFYDLLILLKFNWSFLINSLILLFVTHTNLWNIYFINL